VFETEAAVFVLQRAHCARGQHERFVKDVCDWSAAGRASGIVVLGGLDARALDEDALKLVHASELQAVALVPGQGATPGIPTWWAEVHSDAPAAGSLLPESCAPTLAVSGVRVLAASTGRTDAARLAFFKESGGRGSAADALAAEAGVGDASAGAALPSWSLRGAQTTASVPHAAEVAARMPGVGLAGLTHRYIRAGAEAGLPVVALLAPCFGDGDGVARSALLAQAVGKLLGLTSSGGGDAPLVASPGAGGQFAVPAAWRAGGIEAVVPGRGGKAAVVVPRRG